MNTKEYKHMNTKNKLAQTIIEYTNTKINYANKQIALNKRINNLQKRSIGAINNVTIMLMLSILSHAYSAKLSNIDKFHRDYLKFQG